MKELFSFEVNKKVEKEQRVESGDQTIISKVKEDVPIKIVLKYPSRADIEEADLFYSIAYSKFANMGLLTDALIRKLYSERGGFLTDKEQKELEVLKAELEGVRDEYFASSAKLNSSTDSERKELEISMKDKREKIRDILTMIKSYESDYESLFENTAETKARGQSTFWWILFIPYLFEDNKYVPLFNGKTFEQKRESFDNFSDSEDEFYTEVIKKVLLLVSLWTTGQAQTAEDFSNALEELYYQENQSTEVAPVESTVEESVPTEEITE